MPHITRTVLAGTVAALAIALGVAPATAEPVPSGPASGGPVDGWVVENPRADGSFDTRAGSATVVDPDTGATLSCAAIDGLGYAESGTYRPQDWFASTYISQYGSCTGPGATGLEVFSPEIRFVATAHDPAADRVTAVGIVDIWGLLLTRPSCSVSLYPTDPLDLVPLTYDNRTATFATDPVTVEVSDAVGDECTGLPEVGDVLTFGTTLVASPGFTVRPA